MLAAAHADPRLQIARDLANGLKHFNLDKDPQIKGNNDVTMFVGHGTRGTHGVVYPLVTFADGTQRRALDVAKEAQSAWLEILTNAGLPLS